MGLLRKRRMPVVTLGVAAVVALTASAPIMLSDESEATPVPLSSVSGDLAAAPTSLIASELPEPFSGMSAEAAVEQVIADPELAIERSQAVPSADADEPLEAAIAAADTLMRNAEFADSTEVTAMYEAMSDETARWSAVLFPGVVGNLPGVPFEQRVEANRIRVAAATEESTRWQSPDRPWTDQPLAPRQEYLDTVERDQDLLYFDPLSNSGKGAWVEVLGELETADEVGVLVPGGGAFINSENYLWYHRRANSFVEAADGDLAMIVWAGAPFPFSWIQEAHSSWAENAAPYLADFLRDLRHQVGDDVLITLSGHSYGGAMVGFAETEVLPVDQVMHVASAGMGHGIDDPDDYARPCLTRYSMTDDEDPIAWTQGLPDMPVLGHGADPDEFPGVIRLETGRLPDDSDAVDDLGRPLGELSGKEIGGIHAHSEVYIPHSDAWNNMLAVYTGGEITLDEHQPEPWPGC